MNRPKVPISVASWREIPGNFREILVKSYNLAGSMNGGAHCSLLRRQRLAYNLPIIYKKRLDIKNLWWMQRNSSSKASFLGCSRFRNVSLWRKGFYLGTKQPIGSIREVSTQMYMLLKVRFTKDIWNASWIWGAAIEHILCGNWR